MATKPAHGRDLTQGPIAKTLLLFALPTLVSSILQSLNGSINSIWIGRFLGEKVLLMSFVFGFGMASTVLIGQAFGAKNIDQARRVVGTAIGSFLPVAVVIGVIGWVASPALLRLLAEWFQEQGSVKVCVCVDADSPAAQPFYDSLGASPIKKHWYAWEDIGVVLR